jgi:hypothetical protein
MKRTAPIGAIARLAIECTGERALRGPGQGWPPPKSLADVAALRAVEMTYMGNNWDANYYSERIGKMTAASCANAG